MAPSEPSAIRSILVKGQLDTLPLVSHVEDLIGFSARNMMRIGLINVVGILLTIAIAGFCEIRAQNDFYVAGAILCLMALSSFAFVSRGADPNRVPSTDGQIAGSKRGAKDAATASVLNKITRLLQQQAEENKKFANRLDGANSRLKDLDKSDAVAEIVLTLIRDNQEMSGKIEALTENLTTSKTQIFRLQIDLAKAEQVGYRDKVTEIGNRHFFDNMMEAEIGEARGADRHLCLVMLDIDRFKRINDTFGHVVGDMLLKLVAELLTANLKGQDKVARYGGEEFGILLPNTRMTDAVVVANNMRKELERKRWLVGRSGQELGAVTASFGVAQFDRRETRDQFIARADAALYRAKQTGRNRVEVAENPPRADLAA